MKMKGCKGLRVRGVKGQLPFDPQTLDPFFLVMAGVVAIKTTIKGAVDNISAALV